MIKISCDSCEEVLTRPTTFTIPASEHPYEMWASDEKTWHFCNIRCAYNYLREYLMSYGIVK